MHQALNDRLDDAISHLTDSLAPLPETRIEREALALQKLNVFCLADDANWRTQSAWWQSCVATVTYIYSTLNRYDPTSFADSQAIIEFRQKLVSEINKLQHTIAEGQCWQSDWRLSEDEAVAARECNRRISARRYCNWVRWTRIRRLRLQPSRHQWSPMPLPIQTICATR